MMLHTPLPYRVVGLKVVRPKSAIACIVVGGPGWRAPDSQKGKGKKALDLLSYNAPFLPKNVPYQVRLGNSNHGWPSHGAAYKSLASAIWRCRFMSVDKSDSLCVIWCV